MDTRRLRHTALMWIACLALGVTACGDDGTGPDDDGGNGGGDPVATTSVSVVNNSFEPRAIRVSPGASVTWTWNSSGIAHNVIFPTGGPLSSGTQSSGTFSSTMPTAPGQYAYQCTLHSGMTGSVTVQ